MENTILLQSERLNLLNFQEKHIPEYYKFFQNNPKLLKLTKTDYAPSLLETEEIQKYWKNAKNCYCFVLEEKNNKELIGDINLIHYECFENDEMELSIMISFEKNRRKGYGKESLFLAEEFIKKFLIYKKIICKIDKNNLPSINFFKKYGYVFYKDNERDNEIVLRKIFD